MDDSLIRIDGDNNCWAGLVIGWLDAFRGEEETRSETFFVSKRYVLFERKIEKETKTTTLSRVQRYTLETKLSTG